MKKKFLTRANALIVMLLGVLGFAGCKGFRKFCAPEVLYGPAPYDTVEDKYGIPMPEILPDEDSSAPDKEEKK